MSDEALVAACAVADQAALGALFDRHHLRVHRFLCRVASVTPNDAEDLLQDTFAALWSAAPRYKGRAPALTWLFGIAANVARNHVRSRQRGARAMHVLTETLPPPPDGADIVAARREAMERLQVGLQKLHHDRRVAFVMCDLEGVSGTDAAEILGVRPGTVWRWLHEARKALRLAVGEGQP